MEIVKIDNRARSELYPTNFVGRRARAGMIPRSNNQKMLRVCRGRGIRHVVAIECHRAKLIAVVLAGNSQNGQRHFLELLLRRHHCVVIRVGGRMFQDALKVLGRVADERVERAECDVFFVSFEKFRPPEF